MAHSMRRQRLLRAAVRLGNAEVLRMALCRGTSPNLTANYTGPWASRTVLMRAAAGGHRECVRVLLAHGARAEEFSADGWCTALMLAVDCGDVDIVRMLLEGGARIETPVANGFTPLMTAVRCSRLKVVEALLAAGANPAAVTRWTDVKRSVVEIARETFERRRREVRALQGYDTPEVTRAVRREREARSILRQVEERAAELVAAGGDGTR